MELPQEIAPGTVKYAVWHVLATVNAMGLRVEDILDRIHEMKIKEIGGRTPKITVAGACREGLQQGIFFKVGWWWVLGVQESQEQVSRQGFIFIF